MSNTLYSYEYIKYLSIRLKGFLLRERSLGSSVLCVVETRSSGDVVVVVDEDGISDDSYKKLF